MGRAYHKSTFTGTDIPSTMPLRGREEHESEFHPRHVARRATKGGHPSGLAPHGEADPSNECVGEESTLFTRSTSRDRATLVCETRVPSWLSEVLAEEKIVATSAEVST